MRRQHLRFTHLLSLISALSPILTFVVSSAARYALGQTCAWGYNSFFSLAKSVFANQRYQNHCYEKLELSYSLDTEDFSSFLRAFSSALFLSDLYGRRTNRRTPYLPLASGQEGQCRHSYLCTSCDASS